MSARTRKYHIDGAASMYVGVTFIVGLGAFYSQNNLLYVVFAMALAAMLVSGAIGGSALLRVEARRLPPASATVGEPAYLRYRLINRGRRSSAFAVDISEDPAPRRQDGWRGRLRRPSAFVPMVPARGSVVVEGVAIPERRGEARLGAVRIGSRYPFGIIRKSVRFEQPGAVLVRPRPIEPPPGLLDRAATRPTRRTGERRARGIGAEPEFVALREYVPGDSMRQIAWRASARREGLVVRETAATSRMSLTVVLCLAAEGDEANEHAISCAAGVILEGARRGMRVGLAAPGLGYERRPIDPSVGARNERLALLLDDMARLEPAALDPSMQGAWRQRFDGAVIIVRAPDALLPALDAHAVVLDAESIAAPTAQPGAAAPSADEAAA